MKFTFLGVEVLHFNFTASSSILCLFFLGYTQWGSGLLPGGALEPYGVPRIKPRLAICKASGFPAVLSLRPKVFKKLLVMPYLGQGRWHIISVQFCAPFGGCSPEAPEKLWLWPWWSPEPWGPKKHHTHPQVSLVGWELVARKGWDSTALLGKCTWMSWGIAEHGNNSNFLKCSQYQKTLRASV